MLTKDAPAGIIVPRFADDTPKHREIAAIENFLKNNSASL